jgi:hypothetical protein
MLTLCTESSDNSELFTKLATLEISENLRLWSLRTKEYSGIGVTDKDIQELISLATNLELFESESETERWIPRHAWRILGELSAKDSIEPLIKKFDYYHECDWAYHELPRIIARIGGAESLDKISDHLLDKSRDDYSRFMAAQTIKEIIKNDPGTEEMCLDVIVNCLDESSAELDYFNGLLISILVDLRAISKIDDIRRAFNNDKVDNFVNGDIEDIEIELELRKDRETPPPKFIIPNLSRLFESIETNHNDYSYTKTGRNDPCPCESGKKYKKCCLR